MIEALIGLAAGSVLVLAWEQAAERRAWAELARATQRHTMGTEAPTDIAVGHPWPDAP